MSRQLFTPLLAAVALSLAGCAGDRFGSGRIDFTRVDSSWSRADFAYAAANRDLATEVLGNPFAGVPQAAFDRALTDAMLGAHFGLPTNFTTTPGESARPLYRVRMLWNGPTATNGNQLCDGTELEGGGAEPDGEARVIAAFCRGDRASTYVVGSIGGALGPDDSRFTGFVKQVTMALFPPRDGIFESDCVWSTC